MSLIFDISFVFLSLSLSFSVKEEEKEDEEFVASFFIIDVTRSQLSDEFESLFE
jgi:hypothetical protein